MKCIIINGYIVKLFLLTFAKMHEICQNIASLTVIQLKLYLELLIARNNPIPKKNIL